MKLRVFALLTLLGAAPLGAQPKIEPPVAVRTVVPVYPYDLRREGIVGLVVLTCVIDAQGKATDIVVHRTTHVGFNEAAIEAVRKWKFKPALQDGTPVAQKIEIPLRFTVSET